MNEKSLDTRVAVLENTLEAHLKSCERKHNRSFYVLLTVLGSVIAVGAKVFLSA